MDWKKKSIILIIVLFSFNSCGILMTQKRHFNTYKSPVLQEGDKLPFKTNGVYVEKNSHFNEVFYFYTNGLVKNSGLHSDFWDNPKEIAKKVEDIYIFSSKEFWGDYTIKDDTIYIQIFNHNTQFLYKRWIFEWKGVIKNDTTIEMFSEYSYFGKDQFIHKPVIYGFYPTEIKPDSTKAWFNNKKWFKENLHESRKPK